MKKVKKEGKGNRAYAAKPLEDEEITKFYELGLLGNHSPESLINTLWLRFTINFGMRSVEEHYNLWYFNLIYIQVYSNCIDSIDMIFSSLHVTLLSRIHHVCCWWPLSYENVRNILFHTKMSEIKW
jgi:hypothetical protein